MENNKQGSKIVYNRVTKKGAVTGMMLSSPFCCLFASVEKTNLQNLPKNEIYHIIK